MLTVEQKNKNILARFETKETGTNIKNYTVIFKDKKKAYLICMNGEDHAQATKSCQNRFGAKFDYVR
tara:strand:+ start:388 stop:588 length:201 start_codon:yes stop_codon:yes gene_type:complete